MRWLRPARARGAGDRGWRDGGAGAHGDVEALTGSIEPLMRGPEQIVGIGARAGARVMDAFNRDCEVDEIIGVYDKIRTKA